MRRPIPPGLRLVVKVGSSSLTSGSGGIRPGAIERVADLVAGAMRAGYPTVLVTSGAVASGLPALGLSRRPRDVAGLQVAAAVGQSRLMERYTTCFDKHGLVAGQVLLTRDVLSNRDQYLNARTALDRMLTSGIVPIVNENDTVVVGDLRLGGNDILAAAVSHLVGAGLLLILSDTEGLFSADPRLGDAELLVAVRHNDEILDKLTGSGPLGSGGVDTKVAAARMAAWSGVPTVVASAVADDVIARVVAGDDVGTWVDPQAEKLPARKLWIAFGLASSGSLTIDDGAVVALVERARSLLPVGVVAVKGSFPEGVAVEVLDTSGQLVAKGLVQMGSHELTGLIGKRSELEAIHRDDLVVLR
ncbi:MAG TPA: glutamate 5-kinase [Acidimicrobiia bacterium]|nr:glutamate 5-kinase [Acidimicrobiia bacterium]